MPYNALLLRYTAHVNVEYCASVKAVKYLYKYIFKGHDRAVVSVTADKSSLTVDGSITDEITNYVDCRYIGAMEGVWRIFHFPLQDRHTAVQALDNTWSTSRELFSKMARLRPLWQKVNRKPR